MSKPGDSPRRRDPQETSTLLPDEANAPAVPEGPRQAWWTRSRSRWFLGVLVGVLLLATQGMYGSSGGAPETTIEEKLAAVDDKFAAEEAAVIAAARAQEVAAIADEHHEHLEAEWTGLLAAARPVPGTTPAALVGDNFNPVLTKHDFSELVALVTALLAALHRYGIARRRPIARCIFSRRSGRRPGAYFPRKGGSVVCCC